MKSFSRTILVLSFTFVLAPLITLAAPGIPHQFYGAASYTNGTTPADGISVEAKIGGVVVKSSTVTNGKYGYSPDLFMITDPDSARKGQTISFFLGGVDTGQTTVFDNGGYTQKNLTVSAPASPTPAPASGGGGGGSIATPTPTSTPSPTTAPLSVAAKKADTNNDSKVDVLDFNSVMVNWGSSGGVADFTGDGLVDIFDFNYLMIYWSV